jgi:membrane protein involved in D-alanine export
MLPYAELPYFVFLVILAAPAVVLGILQRSRRLWILAASAVAAVVHFGPVRAEGIGPAVSTGWIALGFAIYQLALARWFLTVRSRRRSGATFALAILLSVAPLVVAKVTPALLPGSRWGFLGLSYVTFSGLDYLICVQDHLVTTLRPSGYLAFLFFFPTLSAGPIDRYRRFIDDYETVRPRGTFLVDLDHGVDRLFWGLFYKFVVAALIKTLWLDRAEAASGALAVASYGYAYSLYLFFDFAGYSALAVGASRWFGIRTPENFDRPFLATNIVDFWNRWHLSLSTWFRDHIYMRLVLASTRGRWFRDRHLGSYLGFLVTFGLMGAWHGLEKQYIGYGFYHAALLIGHSLVVRFTRRWPRLATSRTWRLVGMATTFNAVCLGFLIFSGRLG